MWRRHRDTFSPVRRHVAMNGEGHFLTQDAMEWFYRQYLPGGVPADTEADLVHADVDGSPLPSWPRPNSIRCAMRVRPMPAG